MQEAETVTSQHMTDDPLSLGTQHQLGTHRATYKPPTTASQIILWSIFFLLFLGIALWAMIETVGVYFYHIPWLIVLGGAIVFVIIALHVYRIRNVIQNRTQSVFVYDDGLINVWHTSLQVIYWQRVQAVWHKVTEIRLQQGSIYAHVYTVSCTDGTKLKFYENTVRNMLQLGKLIEEETAHYLFPAILNAYQVGQPVVFGSLTMTREGLSYRSKMLLWGEVKSIKIENWAIVLRKQGKRSDWASVKLGVVPNVEVFKRLVRHVIAETARQLFPAILNRYQMGQPVVFGSLTVTQEGLSHRSHRLPWTRIKRRRILANEISESRLVIRELGKLFSWASVNLDAPQIEVFWMLVDHIRGVSLSGV